MGRGKQYSLVFLGVAGIAGGIWWFRHPVAEAASARRSAVASETGRVELSPAPFAPWERQAPPIPLDESQLDGYLDKVVARAQAYPEAADDAIELGLFVIASKFHGDLGEVVKKQRGFSARMQRAAPSTPAHPTKLPEVLTSLLKQVKEAPDIPARDRLVQRYVEQLGGQPGAVQSEAAEQLRATISD